MARRTAKGSTCPQVLQRNVTALRRDFGRCQDAWQEGYPAFKERLAPDQRARLKALGLTLWRFDLRFRWAIGIKALEFDDRIVTRASAAPTRQGYFLLMRLVDLWFCLDLAFDLYEALLGNRRVEHPNVLIRVRNDIRKHLRVLRIVGPAAQQMLRKHLAADLKHARLVAYLEDLGHEASDTLACRCALELAAAIEQRRQPEAHQILGTAQAIRNRYVHGGETASTGALPAQEKVPVLRLLTGAVQVTCLALATVAGEELVRQLRRQVGIR